MSFRAFREAVFRVPDAKGRLVLPRLHREQQRFTEAMDAADPDTGRRRWLEKLLHWSKKSSKSTEGALAGAHHLVADPHERQDRRIGIASFDEDQSRIIFGLTKQLVDRHPWLRKHVQVGRTEMIFREQVPDHRTGGFYTREHMLQALPRDVKGSHGVDWSLVIRDELWSEPDHSFSEGLIISPTRASGWTLYLSYGLIRTMDKAGVPLHDLLQRARAGDPTLFYSYIGGSGEDAPWKVVPWITEGWIEQQRRLMSASPSRFRRVVLNEPAGADAGLISSEELRASLRTVAEPVSGMPGVRYIAAIDLGLTNDWSALVLAHLDANAHAVVDVVRTWRGVPGAPVDLQAIEDVVVDFSRRFKISKVIADQWQAAHMVQRLARRGVSATSVTLEQARLDRLISIIKNAFSSRVIQINTNHTHLIEQLESVQVVEGRGRRDLLKFAPSTKGLDAGSHDDIVVAMGLTLEELSDRGRNLGAIVMEPMPWGCRQEQNGRHYDCYLAGGMHVPTGDPLCSQCEGHISTRRALEAYQVRTGQLVDLRTFVHSGLIRQNSWAVGRNFQTVIRRQLGY
jgi:hypothetical protein